MLLGDAECYYAATAKFCCLPVIITVVLMTETTLRHAS